MSSHNLSICLLALALALSACGSSGDEDVARDDVTVTITNDGYDPQHLKITAGTRVKFVNRSPSLPGSARDEREGEGIESSPQPGPTKHDGSEVNRASRKGFVTHSLFADEHQFVVFPIPHKYSYGSAFNRDIRGTIEVVPRER